MLDAKPLKLLSVEDELIFDALPDYTKRIIATMWRDKEVNHQHVVAELKEQLWRATNLRDRRK